MTDLKNVTELHETHAEQMINTVLEQFHLLVVLHQLVKLRKGRDGGLSVCGEHLGDGSVDGLVSLLVAHKGPVPPAPVSLWTRRHPHSCSCHRQRHWGVIDDVLQVMLDQLGPGHAEPHVPDSALDLV